MDPVAALTNYDGAMVRKDREAIAQHADALIGWLEKGGYMPVGPHSTDWRGRLTPNQFASMLRQVRDVAEMP